MAALREALEEALAGRGQVIGIVGEPGVGKSRVLHEFRRLLAERDIAYLEGWCQSFGQSIPYLPLQDLVRAVSAIGDADTPAQIAERVHTALDRLGLEPREDAYYLLRLLGVADQSDSLTGMTPEAIQAHTLEVLKRVILAQGQGHPLAVGIEDPHWIDKSSEAFLAHLVESLAGEPILLVTTTRAGYSPPWLDKSYTTQIALRVLSAEASRHIIEATVARSGLDEVTTEAILRKAEGNPLFLEELTLALEAHRALAAAQPLPDTIQGVLAARIDRLPEESKHTLQTASVLGREFTLRLLEEISQGKANPEAQLAALKRLEFLYERTGAEGPVYTFKHVLTQEVAYDSLLSGRRQALHDAAGRAIERFYPDRLEEYCEVLAHHFSRSANKEKALDYLELANRKAAKANAMLEAKSYFDQAMTLLDTMPDKQENRLRRISLLVDQWLVFWLLFVYPEYHALLLKYERMAAELGDSRLLGAFYRHLGHCEWVFGHLDRSLQTLTKAASLVERAKDIGQAGEAYVMLQWIHLYLGNSVQALEWQQPALRAFSEKFSLRFCAWSFAAASWACSYLGRWDQAVEQGEKELKLAQEYSDNSLVSFANWNIAIAYTYKQDLDCAREHAERAVSAAPTPADKVWAQSCLGWVVARMGDAQKGAELLATLGPLYQACNFVPGEVFNATYLGEVYWRSGALDSARATLHHVLDLTARSGMRFYGGVAHRLLGEVATASAPSQGDEVDAAREFEESIAILGEIGAENELALAYAGYGHLCRRNGRVAEARKYFTEALEIFERLGTLIEPDKLRAELAE